MLLKQKPQLKAGEYFFEVVLTACLGRSLGSKKLQTLKTLALDKKAPGMGLGRVLINDHSTIASVEGQDSDQMRTGSLCFSLLCRVAVIGVLEQQRRKQEHAENSGFAGEQRSCKQGT